MSELDIEATWVTTLLDVSALRVKLEESAKAEGLRWYGDGKRDDLQDGVRYRPALDAVYAQWCRKPESWTRLLAYLSNLAMFSENERELRDNLLKLTAFTVAWVEDIDRRALPGYKKGKHG